MTKLSDFLSPIENFQYSINLEFDYNDNEKIASFIPTGSALEIIEEILLSTRPNSTDRTRILTGAYGKGKSHLALAILGMLSGKDKNLFVKIIEKANKINARIAGNINQFFESKTRLLPVILNSHSVDLRATILYGLNVALKRAELSNMMPKTFFDAAIAKIESWEKDYPETYLAFKKEVGSVEETIQKLKSFDSGEYNYFVNIYPSLTSGSEFYPLLGTDLIPIIESIAEALRCKGYDGIYFVYDEFSKFLDGNIETCSQQNIKLLQDIAEFFNRSGSSQLHLLLISHKNIENYVGQLPKKAIDDWRGISKRFKPLSMESSDAELFEMIAEVLKKDEKTFELFKNEHADKFKLIRNLFDSTSNDVLGKRNAFIEIIKHTGIDFVEKCYPLHPYTLLMLPKISELVAQNERTIFTYLASNERHAVKYFVRNNTSEFPIMEPDSIYDFFEPQFKSEPYGSAIRKHWQIATAAIGKISEVDNPLAVKIIKSITLLYIINQFDILPPSLDIVHEMYSAQSGLEIGHAINAINQSKLLIKLEYKPYVSIRDIGGNNADELIPKELINIESRFSCQDALTHKLNSAYLYPAKYNDKYEIKRYFRIVFVDSHMLKKIDNISTYLLNNDQVVDGYFLSVIANNNEERLNCISEIKRLKGKNVIYALPKNPIDISKSVIKHSAIQNILERDKVERSLTQSTIDELKYIMSDLGELIEEYIDIHFFSAEKQKTDYYYNGELAVVHGKRALSNLLTKVCEKLYNKTPVIINENINREKLSPPMKSARKRILEGLFSPIIPPNFGLVGSQDINVARSIYVVTRIVENLENPQISFDGVSDNFLEMFARIESFIRDAMAAECCFSQIYNELKDPERGIALRSGVIPFYLAVKLYPYKKVAVIRKNRQQLALTADILESINENPSSFYLRIEEISEEKSLYISNIERLVAKYVNENEREYSTFNFIVNAIQKWYLHLSRFDRETAFFCDEIKLVENDDFTTSFKRLLSAPEINAYEFLFDRLPRIAKSQSYEVIASKLKNSIIRIENNTKNLFKMFAKDIGELFDAKPNETLSSIFKNYFESLNVNTQNQVFTGLAAQFLNLIRSESGDDSRIINSVIKAMTGFRIDDLSDAQVSTVIPSVVEAKRVIDDFNSNIKDTSTQRSAGYSIRFFDENGTDEVRQLNKQQLPSSARTFANEIEDVFDTYGASLTTAQKVQICLEVMKKILK